MYKKFTNCCLAALITFSISGCLFRELGAPLDDMLAFSGTKMRRLNERVEKFHQALYWGSVDQAAIYVVPELKREFMLGEKEKQRNQKFVDMEVESVIIDEEGEIATVDVRVRYYKIPHYTIEVRNEVETWEFKRFGGGWFLTERSAEELGIESS